MIFAHGSGSSRLSSRHRAVAGATHLFEEPGTLEEVERLAGEWCTRHL